MDIHQPLITDIATSLLNSLTVSLPGLVLYAKAPHAPAAEVYQERTLLSRR